MKHINGYTMKFSIFILVLTIASLGTFAQGNFSPYSQLGLGDIEDNFYNRTSGLSNTGIAYRSNSFLINNNPAAFSGLNNQLFVAETGIRGSLVNYYGKPVDPSGNQSGDITFRRFVMGIKAAKHWGTSFGLVPFATQNYEFSVPYYLQGSTDEIANNYYQGHGSLNKVYWANSYEFWGDQPDKLNQPGKKHKHHISIGVDAGYVFGQLNQKNILQSPSTGASLVSTTNDVEIRNLYMNYGLQIYGRINKKLEYSVGATFSNKQDLFSEATKTVLGPDSSVLQGGTVSQQNLTMPNTVGLGAMVTLRQKYKFLADYKYQGWSDVKNTYPGKDYQLVNSEKGSVGFEISRKKIFRDYYGNGVAFETSYFQAGAYYGKSYLAINGQQIKDYGLTAGFGINSLKNLLNYAIIFQYGIKGTQNNNLVEQRYANVTFIINYSQVWNTRGRRVN